VQIADTCQALVLSPMIGAPVTFSGALYGGALNATAGALVASGKFTAKGDLKSTIGGIDILATNSGGSFFNAPIWIAPNVSALLEVGRIANGINAVIRPDSTAPGLELRSPNNAACLTLTNGAGVFAGTVAASNLSGTNTGNETAGSVVALIAGQAIAPASVAASGTLTGSNFAGEASDADVRTGSSATKMVTPRRLFTPYAEVSLTDAATVTPDFNTGINFSITLNVAGATRQLANPTNAKSGQCGTIVVTQDASGSRALTYGTNWKFPGGAPTLSTGANAIDKIDYFVRANGTLVCTIDKAFA
jgi:predicted secreted protein